MMGAQTHEGERKPHGFWRRPEVITVFADFVAGRIDRKEADRRLEIGHYGEPLAKRTFEWYLKKYLRERKPGNAAVEPSVPEVERTTIGQGGRLVIPAPYREALGLQDGAEVTLWMEEDELHVIPSDRVLKHVQAIVRRYVPADRSLADELIAERRREARRE